MLGRMVSVRPRKVKYVPSSSGGTTEARVDLKIKYMVKLERMVSIKVILWVIDSGLDWVRLFNCTDAFRARDSSG